MKSVPSLAGLVIGLPPLQIKCSGEEETGTPQLGHRDAWAGQGLELFLFLLHVPVAWPRLPKRPRMDMKEEQTEDQSWGPTDLVHSAPGF